MLIPQECHKPTFQIDGPILQQAFIPVTRVMATKQSFGTKHQDEKDHKKKRKSFLWLDDEAEISEDAFEEDDVTEDFASLLGGLAQAY